MALHNFLINSGYGFYDAPVDYAEARDDDAIVEEDENE